MILNIHPAAWHTALCLGHALAANDECENPILITIITELQLSLLEYVNVVFSQMDGDGLNI